MGKRAAVLPGPPSLPGGWGGSGGWQLAVGLGTALVDTLYPTLVGHCWSPLWGDRGCDIPHHPGVSCGAGVSQCGWCPQLLWWHRDGDRRSCWQRSGCWHCAMLAHAEAAPPAGIGALGQSLGCRGDRAVPSLPSPAPPRPVTLRPRAKCHRPSGDTTRSPIPPCQSRGCPQHPARPAGPGGQPSPLVPSCCHT